MGDEMDDRAARGHGSANESEETSLDSKFAPDRPLALVNISTTGTLVAWLEGHPQAVVSALNKNGKPVEMPTTIPLGPDHQTDDRSLFELVVPEDSRVVVDAFVAALSRGVGVARVSVASDPTRAMLLQYLDLQEEHGIILRMLVPADDIDGEANVQIEVSALEPVRPRLGVVTSSEVATILSIDVATTLMLGWTEVDMIGHSNLEFVHPADQARAVHNWMSRLAHGIAMNAQTVRLRMLCKDGSWLWLETSNEFLDRDDGTTVVTTKLIDISEEMSAVEALRRNEQFLRQLTNTVPVGLFHITGGGNVAFVNPVLQALIGGRTVESQAQLADAMVPGQSFQLEHAIDAVMANGIDTDLDISAALRDDGSRWSYRITLQAVAEGKQVFGVLGCVVDVTELRTLADTDTLTGLQNRRWILEVIAAELNIHAGRVSLIFVDLDCFKSVNDQYGHHIGDELLVAVSDRLRTALRPTDLIGRIGGDEFLVVCPGLDNAKRALAVAKRLRHSLRREFQLSDLSIHVTASFGVASGRSGVTVDELVSSADSAMYKAKQVRGGPPVFLG